LSPKKSKVNYSILLGGLAVVLPIIAILGSGFGGKQNAQLESMLTGQDAPSFRLMTLDGQPFDSTQLAGKPAVLNFWSTWCGPCKYEHPLLQDAARAHPDVVFLGVLYQDDPQKALTYLSRAGAAYPNLVDASNRVAIDYGVTGVPETFFISAAGTVVHKEAGPLTPPQLSAQLARIRP